MYLRCSDQSYKYFTPMVKEFVFLELSLIFWATFQQVISLSGSPVGRMNGQIWNSWPLTLSCKLSTSGESLCCFTWGGDHVCPVRPLFLWPLQPSLWASLVIMSPAALGRVPPLLSEQRGHFPSLPSEKQRLKLELGETFWFSGDWGTARGESLVSQPCHPPWKFAMLSTFCSNPRSLVC